MKKNVNWSWNSSFGSDEGSSSKLHDWMGKLNINVDDFGKNRQTEPLKFVFPQKFVFPRRIHIPLKFVLPVLQF